MSERDLKRIEVLSEVMSGRRTVAAGAAVLALSERQAYRLLARYEAGGGAELIHKARGQTSNRSVNAGVRRYAVDLVKTRYADFGPTLATEMLLDKHELRIGRETLRRWMVAEGLWLSRQQRRTFHQPRLRRESFGELVQIDGSQHRWFEQRGEQLVDAGAGDPLTRAAAQRGISGIVHAVRHPRTKLLIVPDVGQRGFRVAVKIGSVPIPHSRDQRRGQYVDIVKREIHALTCCWRHEVSSIADEEEIAMLQRNVDDAPQGHQLYAQDRRIRDRVVSHA